jgi:hypothetical protein
MQVLLESVFWSQRILKIHRKFRRVCSAMLSTSPHKLTCLNIQVHPFFSKGQDKDPGTFQWLPPLGPNRSCLHGINLHPKASQKVAAFDLDGTIINSALRGKVVDGKPAWEWWRSFVPDKLKTLVEEG